MTRASRFIAAVTAASRETLSGKLREPASFLIAGSAAASPRTLAIAATTFSGVSRGAKTAIALVIARLGVARAFRQGRHGCQFRVALRAECQDRADDCAAMAHGVRGR
jgi:hypothetical protein